MIQRFTADWEGTPYLAGQQKCKVGVDCIRLVKAWGEVCFPGRHIDLPRLCQDSAFHDPKVVVSCRKAFIEALSAFKIEVSEAQPGDVVAVSRKDNPFHVGIVCENPLQVLHAEKAKSMVLITSLQALGCDGFRVREVYRFGPEA